MNLNDTYSEFDTYEFEYLSYNIDDLILLYNNIKDDYKYLGFMNNSTVTDFIKIIINNLDFLSKDLYENDDNDNNPHDDNIEEDIILFK
jgi:hypothetical protein